MTMNLEGTVVNGVVVFDGNPQLPEGTRVRVELADDDDLPRNPALEPGTREEELAALRESIEETKAGIGGVDARQFLKELAIKHNLPLQPGE
jgi:hypothetical protein